MVVLEAVTDLVGPETFKPRQRLVEAFEVLVTDRSGRLKGYGLTLKQFTNLAANGFAAFSEFQQEPYGGRRPSGTEPDNLLPGVS